LKSKLSLVIICFFSHGHYHPLRRFVIGLLLTVSPWLPAQTTVATGNIQGMITDPSGAVVPGAKVAVISSATGQISTAITTSAGAYSSGALIPGSYLVRVESPGFKTAELRLEVEVGVTSAGNIALRIGTGDEVITVSSSQVRVNTEQATVGGVVTVRQIESLPIDGRNFLNLAQLEPGVQIQEGSTFDPTKNGFSSISFGSRFGRTARIEVDGLDVSDETVGTTTQNIPASAIQEFQLAQSTLDLSTELTSSGSVNVVSRSGGNELHGETFYLFRDSATAARLPGPEAAPFQRHQFGGRIGGPIIPDKVFFFLDAERTKQDLANPVLFPEPFTSRSGAFDSPFRETETMARLDWQVRPTVRLFYRFSYDQNSDVRELGSTPSFQPFLNRGNTPSHALGLDFITGSFTHTIRLGYMKFRNGIDDASREIPVGPDNPIPNLEINIGNLFCLGGAAYCSGPNAVAPQKTFQSNKQIKYGGSKIVGAHILRYGVGVNRIVGGGFGALLGLAPLVSTFALGLGPDPLTYPADFVFLGNGQGFLTEKPAFGLPGGGNFDTRLQVYFGDTWKLRPNINLSYGLGYFRDTGRTDSDLPRIPVLNEFGSGLGERIRQPNTNLAPQIGITWDPAKNGKTVIRAGGGLFYENALFSNVFGDRAGRLTQGLFLSTPFACIAGAPAAIDWPQNPGPIGTVLRGGGAVVVANVTPGGPPQVAPTFCGLPIGNVAGQITTLQQDLQAATLTAGPTENINFIGKSLSAGTSNGVALFAPNYRTPRSWQMNVGVQRELKRGTVISVDYLRNVGEHFLLGIDVNHTGDATAFNRVNAIAARDAVQTSVGCPTGRGQASCVLAAAGGTSNAQFFYSSGGLDSTLDVTGGPPCPFCAFPGNNANLGSAIMLFPIGRSVYNGLQVVLRQNVDHFFVPGARHANLQVSYSFSRFVSPGQDQDIQTLAIDTRNPLHFTGPNSLDRTHQLSAGGIFELPKSIEVSFVAHFFSPLSQTLLLPTVTGNGEIFVSDLTGDGTTGDIVPGTNVGSFQRDVGISQLRNVISTYNAKFAGKPTPAGQVLINTGILTLSDLQALGWVAESLPTPVPHAVGLDWLRVFDLKLSWPVKIKDKLRIEPSMGIFNLFNFANFDLPGNTQGGVLSGTASNGQEVIAPNVVGGTDYAHRTNRATIQSGTFALGAPRSFEWGLRLSF
jgi:Carboxypeptidase regulatory-like domain